MGSKIWNLDSFGPSRQFYLSHLFISFFELNKAKTFQKQESNEKHGFLNQKYIIRLINITVLLLRNCCCLQFSDRSGNTSSKQPVQELSEINYDPGSSAPPPPPLLKFDYILFSEGHERVRIHFYQEAFN